MSKIKIAYIIDTIDYQMGGTEKQLLMLLDNLDPEKFETSICVFKPSPWILDHQADYNIFYFNFDSFFNPFNYYEWYKFIKFLKTERFDIIQTQFRDANILGVLGGLFAKVRTIISTRRNHGYWLNKTEIFILRFLNKFVDGFIVNSHTIKKYVSTMEKLPPEKITVIYNGLETSFFPSVNGRERAEIRKKFGIPQDISLGIMVANLRSVKGIDTFLISARKVIDQMPNTLFLLVGEGDERNELDELAMDLGIARNVNFLGRREDVPEILKMCDVGVLSSRSEGLANAIIEYMAAGLPVVCTNVGGNAEMVENMKNGIVVPSEDPDAMGEALLNIFTNLSLAEEMGSNSRKKAHHLFDLDNLISTTEAYYEKFALKTV